MRLFFQVFETGGEEQGGSCSCTVLRSVLKAKATSESRWGKNCLRTRALSGKTKTNAPKCDGEEIENCFQTNNRHCRFSAGILRVGFLAPSRFQSFLFPLRLVFNISISNSARGTILSPSPWMAVLCQRGNWTLRAGTFPAVDLIKYVPP